MTSKQRSGSRLSLLEDLKRDTVFFTDRNITGSELVEHLTGVGFKIEPHYDHFEHDEDDDVWIADVASRGWLIISADRAAERLYRDTIVRSKAFFVVLNDNSLGPRHWASMLTVNQERLLNLANSQARPFVVRISKTGQLKKLFRSDLIASVAGVATPRMRAGVSAPRKQR